jgi:hypothetical protein
MTRARHFGFSTPEVRRDFRVAGIWICVALASGVALYGLAIVRAVAGLTDF